ncbi:MAG: hypothetical protein ACFFHV_06325 [Promethearchaeota archaeon]
MKKVQIQIFATFLCVAIIFGTLAINQYFYNIDGNVTDDEKNSIDLAETNPNVGVIDYKNGTTKTVIDYGNGTKLVFIENKIIKEIKSGIDPEQAVKISSSLDEATGMITEVYKATLEQEILMGYSWQLIEWDTTLADLVVVKAGIEIDIGFGVRLPVEVKLEYPSQMAVEHDYICYATLIPINKPSYEEFKCSIEANGWIWVGIPGVIGDEATFGPDYDFSKSFTTPLGSGAAFPIDPIEVELYSIYLIGLDLVFNPQLGSDKITARASATGDGRVIGQDVITWTAPNQKKSFTVRARDYEATDYATIILSDFRYYFSKFDIDIGLKVDFCDAINLFIPDPPTIYFFTVDMGWLTGGAYLGVHPGTDGTVDKSVFVEDYGVELYISPSISDAVPGFPTTFNIKVTNKGNVQDTFKLTLAGLPSDWEYVFSKSTVTLGVGNSEWVQLHITPKRHYSTSPGNYPFSVTGTSQKAQQQNLIREDTVSATVRVLPFYEFSSAISDDITVIPGELNKFTIQIQNLGNVEDTYSLNYIFKDFASQYEAYPTVLQEIWFSNLVDSVTLGPGEKSTIEISVIIPQNWAGFEDTIYEMETIISTVHASSQALDFSIEAISLLYNKLCYLDWQLEELKDYITSKVWIFGWILNYKLSQVQNMLQEAHNLVESGEVTCSLYRDLIAQIHLKITEFWAEILNWFHLLSDEELEYISDSINDISNHIVLFMGASVGTEQAFNIALIEVDLLNLLDFLEEEMSFCKQWLISSYVGSAAVKLEVAIFMLSLGFDVECILTCAQSELEKAECVINLLLDKGKISQELADTLLFEIDQAQEDIEVVK